MTTEPQHSDCQNADEMRGRGGVWWQGSVMGGDATVEPT